MSEQRKVSFVCSSSSASFASFRGEEQQIPERAGRALAEVSSSSKLSFLSSSSSPLFSFVPSFDLVLSAVATEEASYDGEESSFFEPEPVQGRTAAY